MELANTGAHVRLEGGKHTYEVAQLITEFTLDEPRDTDGFDILG